MLQLRKDTQAADVRANYFRVSRLVHPDKCSHPRAAEAAAVVNQGYATLSNPVKKVLYDRHASAALHLHA
jgi:curved DNA-binding protein CbpA